MEINDQVYNYLDTIPEYIKQRGEQLIENGKVLEGFIDEIDGFFEFQVLGNSKPAYDVEVWYQEGLHFPGLRCNCPYFADNGMCKHAAAGALETLDIMGRPLTEEEIRELPGSRKDTSYSKPSVGSHQPVEVSLDNPEEATPQQVASALPKEFSMLMATEVKLLPEVMEVTLKSMFYSDQKMHKAWLKKTENGFELECDDPLHKTFCTHLLWIQNFLQQQAPENLFTLMSKEVQRAKAESALKQVDIDPEGQSWQDLVELRYNGKSFGVSFKGALEGLSTGDNASEFMNAFVLAPFSSEEKKKRTLAPEITARPEKTSLWLPAFVFMLNRDSGRFRGIQSVCGNPNKDQTKITSHLQSLYEPYGDKLIDTGNLERLFFIKERLRHKIREAEIYSVAPPILNDLNAFAELAGTTCLYASFEEQVTAQNFKGILRKSDLHILVSLVTNVRVKFVFREEPLVYTLKSYLELPGGETLDLQEDDVQLFDNVMMLDSKNRLGIINSVKEAVVLESFKHQPVLRTTRKELPEFLNNVVRPLADEFPVTFEDISFEMTTNVLAPAEKRVYVSELDRFVMLRPVMLYDDGREVNVLDDSTPLTVEDNHAKLYERDREAEQQFLEEVAGLHPSFRPDTQQSFFYMSFQEFQKDHWFLRAFEAMKAYDIRVFGLNEMENFRFSPHTPSVDLKFRSRKDWFETDVDIAFGDNKVTTKQIKKAVQQGSPYVELSDGTLGIIPEEWMKKFAGLFRSGQVNKNGVSISKTQFNGLDDVVDEEMSPEIYREIKEKQERLEQFSGIKEAPVPSGLKAELRDYQKEGLNWLSFLREFKWGGILADDMGLGKTLQALALICLEAEQNSKKPNLVIAPTTLLFNWKDEIEKFAPDIDYFVHHGQRYDSPDELQKHQLVLTSYGVAVNDTGLLEKIPFNMIIADESQAIKNINSKRYKALSRLKGDIRLAMTGTPVENNIFELYAQMTFANPGFFQGLTHFKEHYARPVERDRNQEVIRELNQKTKPFILRRTKDQVLQELPEKTEEYIYCEMSAEQRKVYDAYRNDYRNYLLNLVEEEGVENSQMYVLEGLTKLRQICDSPALLEKEGLSEAHSAKADELLRHVQEKTGEHKILVFSQFVKMLKLLSHHFDALNIDYEYLDGSTTSKERERKVNRFQNDAGCKVFLISLKAGGTGLNLTSADYVYIVDPWWNPAVENQAIDRCYRMGQEKKVFAYRMVCTGTVEEKILELQENKKALSEDVVGSGEGVMKKLSKSDIEALFS